MFVFQVFQNLPKKGNKAENKEVQIVSFQFPIAENTDTINLILKLKNIEFVPNAMYIEHIVLCVQCTFNPKWAVD